MAQPDCARIPNPARPSSFPSASDYGCDNMTLSLAKELDTMRSFTPHAGDQPTRSPTGSNGDDSVTNNVHPAASSYHLRDQISRDLVASRDTDDQSMKWWVGRSPFFSTSSCTSVPTNCSSSPSGYSASSSSFSSSVSPPSLPHSPAAPISYRPLSFSISEILKPEFGRRICPSPLIAESLGDVAKGQGQCDPYFRSNTFAAPHNTSVTSTGEQRQKSAQTKPRTRKRKAEIEGLSDSRSSRPMKRDRLNIDWSHDVSVPSVDWSKDGLPIKSLIGVEVGSADYSWIQSTRHTDKSSSAVAVRTRKPKRNSSDSSDISSAQTPARHDDTSVTTTNASSIIADDAKRHRTAFHVDQLARLHAEFATSPYLTEDRRRQLARHLSLTETQVKIWFQNKRAKLKKTSPWNFSSDKYDRGMNVGEVCSDDSSSSSDVMKAYDEVKAESKENNSAGLPWGLGRIGYAMGAEQKYDRFANSRLNSE